MFLALVVSIVQTDTCGDSSCDSMRELAPSPPTFHLQMSNDFFNFLAETQTSMCSRLYSPCIYFLNVQGEVVEAESLFRQALTMREEHVQVPQGSVAESMVDVSKSMLASVS